ncbi:hypothetical protein GCM10010919_05130 [Alishewanella longhuensis]|uniref:HEAT repeat domain-containing protein n=1 Tax=Alishewanella longhuensis TaxID=1091037 RepID=A0ABQ3KTY6_9ALTE|nr:hypothetical protein [Alishewanella longhuensis]GHG61063.1 hypothetical protein GCM10010919_05130 [Alishewanella longhuensis]
MQKTIFIILALIITATLVYQAGKWSGKQLAAPAAASQAAQQTDTVIPAQATLMTAGSLVPAGNVVAAAATLPTDTIDVPAEASSQSAIYDLAELIQMEENTATLNLTESVLKLNPEQLQQAMWQLEQQATNTSTYQRQQQLQQQFNHYALGTLLQLNCSDTLCIAMLQYDNPQLRKAAMPMLSKFATSEQIQATFLSKDHEEQHYSFFMLYGWL